MVPLLLLPSGLLDKRCFDLYHFPKSIGHPVYKVVGDSLSFQYRLLKPNPTNSVWLVKLRNVSDAWEKVLGQVF